MYPKLGICFVVALVVLGFLVAQSRAVISHAEFKKKMLSANPAIMTPQCKKVFKACSMKLLSMLGLLDALKDRWDDYTSVPCVKTMLENNFPDHTLECSQSGIYGQMCRSEKKVAAFRNILFTEEFRPAIEKNDDDELVAWASAVLKPSE